MEESQKILKLAVSVGELLLKSGGEIYRVQETVERILEAYAIEDYHVFVVSNGIFATIYEEEERRGSVVRYVPLEQIRLDKIMELNQLSREICDHECDLDQAFERLKQCREKPGVGKGQKRLAGGMGSAAFCYLYGGRPVECILAFFLGILLQVYLEKADQARVSKFIINIIGSALVTAISFGAAQLGLDFMQDKVVIGSIIVLVPGVALTTSIRELFNGDYLSGCIHLADALMTAVCIAVGVGGAVLVFHVFGGAYL